MRPDARTPSLEVIAAAMLGAAVSRVEPAGGGGNSRIYRVESARGAFAMKQYPLPGADVRDRLGVEKAALQFFARHHLTQVPHWLAAQPPYALMSWVDGTLAANDPTDADIESCLAFLAQIRPLSVSPEAFALGPASEACLSGAEIERQIEARLARLYASASAEPLLSEFLLSHFLPAKEARFAAARLGYTALGMDFESEVAHVCRALIPADFGLHNALKDADGKLTFIDFEYFGWDDPVKLTADFILHPAMVLNAEQKRNFAAGMTRIFADDARFPARLALLLPCFGLRWTLILLNEFLPERLSARAFARGETDLEALKRRQLDKARLMLETQAL